MESPNQLLWAIPLVLHIGGSYIIITQCPGLPDTSRCYIHQLTEIQELLDGQRGGGELGVVLDLIGDGVLQQVHTQPHDAPLEVGEDVTDTSMTDGSVYMVTQRRLHCSTYEWSAEMLLTREQCCKQY